MNEHYKTELWGQFGAALDMFENALQKCPENIWDDGQNFWYIGFHTLFFLDYYISEDPEHFNPPPPFSLAELDPAGVMPERTYTKEELINYTHYCRDKWRKLIADFDEVSMFKLWKDDRREYTMLKMSMYNMRHVMHHTGQLNMMLGKIDHDLPIWVSQTKIEL